MPTFDTAFVFLGVSLLLAFAPGPDNLFVLMQSAMYGRRAGMWIVLGLCTGLIVHTAAVAVGLAAVFAASATAFLVLKFAGAAYLLWLAWQAWRAPPAFGAQPDARPMRASRLYARGVIMNLTNPKVVLFFLALLPQFVRPGQGVVAWQICWLGALFAVATLIAFGAIACFADFLGQRLRRSTRAQRLLNRVAAAVFASLALRLAFVTR